MGVKKILACLAGTWLALVRHVTIFTFFSSALVDPHAESLHTCVLSYSSTSKLPGCYYCEKCIGNARYLIQLMELYSQCFLKLKDAKVIWSIFGQQHGIGVLGLLYGST